MNMTQVTVIMMMIMMVMIVMIVMMLMMVMLMMMVTGQDEHDAGNGDSYSVTLIVPSNAFSSVTE